MLAFRLLANSASSGSGAVSGSSSGSGSSSVSGSSSGDSGSDTDSSSGSESGDDIYVMSGSASSEWSSGWALSLGYSKKGVAESPGTCFYSKSNKNQWAVLSIPTSGVTQVQLLSYSTYFIFDCVLSRVHSPNHFHDHFSF